MPMFDGLDHAQFMKLMADTTERLYSSFSMTGGHVSSDGVGQLVTMIRDALPAGRRVEALEAAVGLAKADGVESVEALLLQRLCEGLEIEETAASRLLGRLLA
jgi:hypothetical protein